jgi:anti-sigma-K factor RskA
LTCGEVDVLRCFYLEGALRAADARRVEGHLETCAACAELVRDSRQVTAFIGRAEEAEPPARLLTQILNETASGRHGRLAKARGLRGWLENLLAPALQPRLVMGMALTILSFSMMARCAGISPRELTAADMNPRKIWASIDDRVHRAWGRSVKFYEDIKFVYEIQSRLRDWSEQQEEEERNASKNRPVEERRVPASAPPAASPQEPAKAR